MDVIDPLIVVGFAVGMGVIGYYSGRGFPTPALMGFFGTLVFAFLTFTYFIPTYGSEMFKTSGTTGQLFVGLIFGILIQVWVISLLLGRLQYGRAWLRYYGGIPTN